MIEDNFDKKENKKFIKISYLMTDKYDNFYEDEYMGYTKLVCKETYINLDQVVEVSSIDYDIFVIKNYENINSTTARELRVFTIYLSDGRKYKLESSEFYKFNDLIYE